METATMWQSVILFTIVLNSLEFFSLRNEFLNDN